ncbi:MAG: thioredoxin domain-containing protein [Gemmatimonadetes bacterium]|nr:thioredoxin domain-containing protein [Gemmatimonadota bacterium]
MSNRLTGESSPYLRQHAANPVDWYPWGPEALDLAVQEDRPILLSIGYSSCHWCHVMERESFEDTSVATLMNELFVNIKVDREERPDIDQVYMKAVQAMTGGGGWPMTLFLTPERVPFHGGTYFPPEPRHGMPSFTQVLRAAAAAYRDRTEAVRSSGVRLIDALATASRPVAGNVADEETLDAAYRALSGQYDATHGGFGRAPKFPQPVTLEFLLRHHVRTGDATALDMVVHTLRRMAAGGMRDHLGGGFHRYSVDAGWLVPHFEKMLYDNALLARAYLDAFRLTEFDDLRAVVVDTLDYLAADMQSSEGGFFAARDADSEGVEGTFYVWTPTEIETLLGTEEARLFSRVYDVSTAGNFDGRSILHLPHEIGTVARAEGIGEAELEQRMTVARHQLHEERATREAPFRDEKIIVAWNGLALRAFAEAGATLGRPDYLEVARRAADFAWTTLRVGDRLFHSYMEGVSKVPAFLDDHAALGNGYLSLHGATLERRWLDATRWLCDEILDRFWDDEAGTVFDSAHDAESLILRPRDPMDNATPSGPSLAAELLARAGQAFDDDRYRDAARAIVDREAVAMARYGPAFGRMLSVLDRTISDPIEIAIVGGDDEATAALIQAAHTDFLAHAVIVGRKDGDAPAGIPLLEGRDMVDGQPTVYVCRRYACRNPVTDVSGVLRGLRAASES